MIRHDRKKTSTLLPGSTDSKESSEISKNWLSFCEKKGMDGCSQVIYAPGFPRELRLLQTGSKISC